MDDDALVDEKLNAALWALWRAEQADGLIKQIRANVICLIALNDYHEKKRIEREAIFAMDSQLDISTTPGWSWRPMYVAIRAKLPKWVRKRLEKMGWILDDRN